MKLTFYGGAGAVTGANYVLESGGTRIMIDCGLEQGSHYAERKNFEPFAYDPGGIEAVFVTHAHLDHIGRVPKLWKDGFRGTIYSTPPTREFGELILLDSEHVLGEEAEREKRPPIYAAADVAGAMKLWKGLPYHEPLVIGPFTIALYDAGHILGSATVHIEAEGKTIVFSGDLGNSPAPIIRSTETYAEADYCVIESAYGDRTHEEAKTREEMLEDAVEDTVRRDGVLMVPAFAMERTQDLLFHLHRLVAESRVPRAPVFIDSPLAIKLTEVYERYPEYFNDETKALVAKGQKLFSFPGLRFTLTTEESKKINDVPAPKIVVAGSGMSHGGRILHHERRYLSDPKSMIIFIGYQAAGSLGRRIMEGAETVKIFGEDVPVRCEKREISAYSAHADEPRLLAWIRPMRAHLKKAFVVQGEPQSSAALAQRIRDDFAVHAEVPKENEETVL